MKKSFVAEGFLIVTILLLILAVFSVTVFIFSVNADDNIWRSDNTYLNNNNLYGDSTAHECVDEAVIDNDSTYIVSPMVGSFQHTVFDVDGLTDIGTINSVTVSAWVRRTAFTGYYAYVYVTNGVTPYESTPTSIGTTYMEINRTFVSNPYTSDDWEWSELNDLQVGVRLMSDSYPIWSYTRCTQVYMTVDYDPYSSEPPSGVTSFSLTRELDDSITIDWTFSENAAGVQILRDWSDYPSANTTFEVYTGNLTSYSDNCGLPMFFNWHYSIYEYNDSGWSSGNYSIIGGDTMEVGFDENIIQFILLACTLLAILVNVLAKNAYVSLIVVVLAVATIYFSATTTPYTILMVACGIMAVGGLIGAVNNFIKNNM